MIEVIDLEKETISTKIKFIRGFGDKTRMQILEILKGKELTVSQIVETVRASQSSVSQHIGCLKGCGLITGRQEGKYIYYSLSSDKIKLLLDMFDEVFADVQSGVACCENHFEPVEG
jgi:DNA-binding transcriptional ArsR family regulator